MRRKLPLEGRYMSTGLPGVTNQKNANFIFITSEYDGSDFVCALYLRGTHVFYIYEVHTCSIFTRYRLVLYLRGTHVFYIYEVHTCSIFRRYTRVLSLSFIFFLSCKRWNFASFILLVAIPYSRIAQIPAAIWPELPNFVRCRIIFVGPQIGTWVISSLWGLDFFRLLLDFWKIWEPPCHILLFRFLAAYEVTPSFS